MSKKYLPFGAHKILELRKAGKRTNDLIIVSQVGKVDCVTNPVVILQEGIDHDWIWAQGLNLCFWTEPKFYEPKQLHDAYFARPRKLLLWNWIAEAGFDVASVVDPEKLDLPCERWEKMIFSLPWLPFQNKEFAMGELQWK